MPSKTYALDIKKGVISGFTDGIEAVKQAIYLMLNTDRYKWEIYSWNYGSELESLIGSPIPYVYAKIKENITDALMRDDRILSVSSFDFSKKKSAVSVSFTVSTIYGDVQEEVSVNV
jgi:phage baseplate assembly protein W